MIRLLLDPPRFECETATDAASLAKLLGIVVERIETPRPVAVKRAVEIVAPPDEDETARPIGLPQGRMKPTGHSKECQKCGAEFPVLDRSDCPSVYCRACRPAPNKPRKPRLPMPAAVKPARVTASPKAGKHSDPVSCTSCGASVPEFESIDGECLQCAPMAARKKAS